MKTLCMITLAVAAAATAFHFVPIKTSAKSDKFHQSQRPVPNRYIVVFDEAMSNLANDARGLADDLNRDHPGIIHDVYSSAINGYSVELSYKEAIRLSEDPRVKFVEQDSFVSETDVEANPGWGLDRLDQRALPYDLAYSFNGQGNGVNVYVLDSGILPTHIDLQGRVVSAFDAVHDNTPLNQCNGHGTGVAGVVGSTSFGVAKQVMLYDVRVLPCTGDGTVSNVISGIDWITKHAIKPAVANVSLQAGFSPSMNSAVIASINSGVTYIVAAGNNNENACNWSPSAVASAVVAGATNSADTRVGWSNFGACVDLFAPGEGVSTIWNGGDTVTTYASGTSFSSPYATGVAALYLEQHPTSLPSEVASALVSSATTNVVIDPGVDSPNLLLYSMVAAPAPVGCSGNIFTGSLPSPGTIDYQSNISGFTGNAGKYSAKMQLPTDASFSLSLERKGGTKWSAVATSVGGSITYMGRSGIYRWKVADVSGSGSYSLCAQTP
jgi:subtilisin family serine protease